MAKELRREGGEKEKDAPPLFFFLMKKNENFNFWCNFHVNPSKTTNHGNGISLPRRVRLAKQRTRL
jgi:hypothetical protein